MHCGVMVTGYNQEDWPRLMTGDYDRPPETADYLHMEDTLYMGELVEPLGFDSIWATEHYGSAYSMQPNPLQYLAYWAGRTKRVDMGTAVIVAGTTLLSAGGMRGAGSIRGDRLARRADRSGDFTRVQGQEGNVRGACIPAQGFRKDRTRTVVRARRVSMGYSRGSARRHALEGPQRRPGGGALEILRRARARPGFGARFSSTCSSPSTMSCTKTRTTCTASQRAGMPKAMGRTGSGSEASSASDVRRYTSSIRSCPAFQT